MKSTTSDRPAAIKAKVAARRLAGTARTAKPIAPDTGTADDRVIKVRGGVVAGAADRPARERHAATRRAYSNVKRSGVDTIPAGVPATFAAFRKWLGVVDRKMTVSRIREGFEPGLFADAARHLSVPKSLILQVTGVHPATFARKESAKAALDRAPSERLARIAAIEARAIEVFGAENRAAEWLRTPNYALGDESPLSQLDTDIGSESVRQILNAIEYGGAV